MIAAFVKEYNAMGHALFVEDKLPPRGGRIREILHEFIQSGRSFAGTHRLLLRAVAATACAGVLVFANVDSRYLEIFRSGVPRSSPTTVAMEGVTTPLQGLTIANNGLVYLQGARIVGISESAITVVSEWNGSTFRWITHINSGTRFVRTDGERGTLADIEVGGFVAVTGHLAGGSSSPLIEASVIRMLLPQAFGPQAVHLQEMEAE